MEISLKIIGLISLSIIVFYLGRMEINKRTGKNQDYYVYMKDKHYPLSKGKLICGDTTMSAFKMVSFNGYRDTYFVTTNGWEIYDLKSCAYLEIELLPDVRKAQKLTEFQILKAKDKH